MTVGITAVQAGTHSVTVSCGWAIFAPHQQWETGEVLPANPHDVFNYGVYLGILAKAAGGTYIDNRQADYEQRLETFIPGRQGLMLSACPGIPPA